MLRGLLAQFERGQFHRSTKPFSLEKVTARLPDRAKNLNIFAPKDFNPSTPEQIAHGALVPLAFNHRCNGNTPRQMPLLEVEQFALLLASYVIGVRLQLIHALQVTSCVEMLSYGVHARGVKSGYLCLPLYGSHLEHALGVKLCTVKQICAMRGYQHLS